MARSFAMAVAVACLCSLFAFGQAQTTANQPSKYIWWENAQITAGKYELFNKVIAQYREATTATAPDMYWITGTPITGESGRVTFVTFHDNMASVEKMMTAFDKVEQAIAVKDAAFFTQAAEAAPTSHWGLAEYSKELSYRPDLVPVANTTWWAGTLFNLKPGCEYEFGDVVKQVADLHKKAGDNEHWTAYEIRGGYPEPSVLFVSTLRSLADLDQEPTAAAKELFESAPMKQMFQKIGKECISHIESTYTRVDPKLSRVSQSVVAANPDFWTIKEEAPAVAATKKGKPKKESVVPAALKEKEKKQ
jgi:hypothetical protein